MISVFSVTEDWNNSWIFVNNGKKNRYTLGPVWLALISAGADLGNQGEPPSGSTAPVGCYWGYE
jgi:hypothetical protein